MDTEIIKKIKLQDCPKEFKKWRTLSDYRIELYSMEGVSSFSNFSLVEKISELLMSLDYLISLELWLSPFSIIGKRHKSIFIQQLGSVYEALLEILLDRKLKKVSDDNPIINNETLSRGFNTFGVLVRKFDKAEVFTENQMEYLRNLSEYRNLIHLNKHEKQEILDWASSQNTIKMRKVLDDFIRKIFKEINK